MRIFDAVPLCSRMVVFIGFCCLVYQAHAADARFGRPATAEEIAVVDISIPPDGEGLPAGSGDAKTGRSVYVQKCASCHAEEGKGAPADALVGGIDSLASVKPVKTVGSYWPYATTLFDYIRRSMPLNAPMSLTNDEVYAVTAYLLAINGILPAEQALDAVSLPLVHMPNRDGFMDRSGVR